MTSKHTTGREYLRVSLDKSGKARSVDEQHDDNQRAADERRTTLGKRYVDNSVSASRYTDKVRDDFVRLLADLDKGRFGADELWLWESSRGSRRVGEWVELIEACERAGVSIFVTTHGRLYDPANGRDRRSLLEDAVDSEYESSKVSVRAKRAAAANAAAGKPHGPTPYGYQRVYDPKTRDLVVQEPHPDEAPVVRELFDRLRSGHSLRSIAIDFERRGIRTRPRTKDGVTSAGKVFSAQHLRELAMTPVYVGIRTHTPGRTGTKQRAPKHQLEGAVKGTWEPLVTEETFYEVRRLLTRPERKTTRPGRATHLLSMIARCAVCNAPLAVTYRSDGTRNGVERPRRPQYQCHRKGCVRVDKAELDAIAEKTIIDHLSKPDVFKGIEAAATTDDELQRVRGDLAVARAELNELRDNVSAGRLSVANLTAVGPGLEARVAALEAQERDLSTPSVLRGMITPGKQARRDWENAPMSTRREVARWVLAPDRVGVLVVKPRPRSSGNRHVPAEDRFDLVPATR